MPKLIVMRPEGFFSSFEASDPVPTWTDTVDTDDHGDPRARGATMLTRPGDGPSSAYTAKPNAGFTGLHALRYEGSHTSDGPAHVVNKIFWVEVPVEPDTELSYVIFPERLGEDLRYPSTFVAVDLAFTDGTFLSELDATDHLGFPLSARGQGESNALYPQQWNRRTSRIGDVAAGKTITRVLLGYEGPHGPARFAGWVDDIAIRTAAPPDRRRPTDYVITTRGTNATRTFSRGNTFPATAVPHGFNFWTPITNAGVIDFLYEYHRGNNDQNRPALQAFGVSHLPSPWMRDRHTFQVMPSAAAGRPNPGRRARALPFQHDNEVARAHYYGVRFDNGIRAEITPTDHAAMFRFTFPGDASLIFDNVSTCGGLTVDPAGGRVTGYSDVRSGHSGSAGRMFVYATFDRPAIEGGKLRRGLSRRVTGFLRFEPRTTVVMRIATSLISLEQARRNLELEIDHDDTFDTVLARARNQWDELLGRVEVEGATEDQLVTLYSNLYRLFLYPNRAHENTGTSEAPAYAYASPFTAKVVPGRIYVNNGFWDTYRTVWPAYALLAPAACGEMVDGFVQHYRDGGWIARWSSPGYANLMTGTSSDVAFADVYLKGVTNFDVRAAYDAALRNATVIPPNDSVGRKGLDRSIFRRYTDLSTFEGLSWTLDGCVNDFGIANLAHALGDRHNHAYFLDRARNYVHLFDQSIGFFQGRTADDGAWRSAPEDYDPRVWGCYDYTETNGWNAAFAVPHDGQGLANLYGGRAALAAKLDAYFATPETGRFPGTNWPFMHEITEARDLRMGQYGHSNQPAHHIIYMYAYAGRPWQAQLRVREVLSRAYSGSEIGQGYCGDEDNGEMSAWWLFSALGCYPLQVGSPTYVIGSPLFTKATVHLENGRDLVINAPNNGPRNVYVQGLRVNGEPYEETWLRHDVLASGAVLDFDLGPEPSTWGSGPDAVPPSITTGDAEPTTLWDVTALGYGRAVASDGRDPAKLFDDTTRTQHRLTGSEPWLRWTLPQPQEVLRYTLTSGRWAGDPRSWTLAGSVDGEVWTVIDERTDQDFRWRRQTRAFTVDSPGRYAHYRLTITSSTETWTVLTQIELLAR